MSVIGVTVVDARTWMSGRAVISPVIGSRETGVPYDLERQRRKQRDAEEGMRAAARSLRRDMIERADSINSCDHAFISRILLFSFCCTKCSVCMYTQSMK
jgi:hypothetical protein